jgi:hypothetical protein
VIRAAPRPGRPSPFTALVAETAATVTGATPAYAAAGTGSGAAAPSA